MGEHEGSTKPAGAEAARSGATPASVASAGLDDAAGWIAVASGLAKLGIAATADEAGKKKGLRLDYDFAGGGGFVVARREIAIDLPEAWEMVLSVRGGAPANTLEIKLADAAGTSVWRWVRASFEAPGEWTELRAASRDFAFAWGPAGGGTLVRTGAVEIAIVAPPGGEGFVELAGFRIEDRSAARQAHVTATSTAPGFDASGLLDAPPKLGWRSEPGAEPHSVTIEFAGAVEVGGLILDWDAEAPPRAFRVEVRGDGDTGSAAYEAPRAGAPRSFVPVCSLAAQQLRIEATPLHGERGVGLARIEVKPATWSASESEFLTNAALGSQRGAWPRYLVREQTLWTPVASPSSGPVGLLSDDGAVEVGEGGFMLEPSLLVGDPATWLTWADVERSAALEETPLPVATVHWSHPSLHVAITAWAADAARVMVRYRVSRTSGSAPPVPVRLLVVLRPLQVTPPWQAHRKLGGPSPIRSIAASRGTVLVNDAVAVRPRTAASDFGAAGFDEGGVAAFLAHGELPSRKAEDDAAGRSEGVFAFDIPANVADAGEPVDVYVECSLAGPDGLGGGDAAASFATALSEWRDALAGPRVEGSAAALFDDSTTAVGHILACRDGAALQPGPRRYTRSWIRDGAIMSAALLRAGHADAASDFVHWYAPFVRADGFVPCCVDRDGVDPLVEHDSHGQFLHAVAELVRFGGDADAARELWPLCTRVAAKIEELRDERRSDGYRSGPHRAAFALLPESVSHEGYLAQPVHSYWDDFWALRGLRDAAWLAERLGERDDARKWTAAAADLATAIAASVRIVMKDRNLTTVPASVEWADFDPTAIAGAVALVGAADLFPADALHRTFDEYLHGLRGRSRPGASWNNYTPYEIRIVGALVHLGRRDDANEVLDFLLGGRRPAGWKQWPEIVWRDADAPAHLGDLPHCWIGAEYAMALRSMLVYERERDGALVVGAGLRREWIDGGLDAAALPTWYGELSVSIRRTRSGRVRVELGGAARPPGGFVVLLEDRDVDVVETR